MLSKETFQITFDMSNDNHIRSNAEMIIEAASLAGSGYAVILGGGRCPEIPIRYLCAIFDRIDFVDLDNDALVFVETQCQQLEEAKGKCMFYHADIIGIIDHIESEAQNISANSSDPLACLDSLGDLLTSTKPNFWMPSDSVKYNLVICSGILTQLQATAREEVQSIFLSKFPDHVSTLSSYEYWKQSIWNFARSLEDDFIDYLDSSSVPEGIIYLSDTVHVCWIQKSDYQTFMTEGAWITTRTSRLADYIHLPDKIIKERQWQWARKGQEGIYWGRLYGVQAIIYRNKKWNIKQ